MAKDYSTGPYGQYAALTTGHIINALYHYGIPLHVIDGLSVGIFDGIIDTNKFRVNKIPSGKLFCDGKYFKGIDQPLFRFEDLTYQCLQDEEGNYQLTLGNHDQPSLVLHGVHCRDAYPVIRACLTNYRNDPAYDLKIDSGAFFQSGSDNPDSNFYYLNFINAEKAQLWLDYFNQKLKEARNQTKE